MLEITWHQQVLDNILGHGPSPLRGTDEGSRDQWSTLLLKWQKALVGVTVHLLSHGIFLLSFLCCTHLLFGMCSYDWVHCLILLSSLNSSLVELWPRAVPLLFLPDGIIPHYSFMLTNESLSTDSPTFYPILSYRIRVPYYSSDSILFHGVLRLRVPWYK